MILRFCFSFLFSCICSTLTANADRCGVEGCGDLTLTGLLDNYEFGNAVVTGNTTGAPGWSTLSSLCYDLSRQAKQNNTQLMLEELMQHGPELAKAINNGQQPDTARANQEMVKVAFSFSVLSGPVSIFSKKHATKWASAWVDFMLPNFVGELSADTVQALIDAGNKVPTVDVSQLGKFQFTFFEQDRY